MLAYLLIHTSAAPLGYVLNAIIYLVIALILFLVIKTGAAELAPGIITPGILKLIGLLLFLGLLLALFVGCSTTGPDPAKNARNAGINAAGSAALSSAGRILGYAATQALFSVAQAEASGGKVDFVQAASAGLWSQANGATTSQAISDIVNAFSAGKAAQTAKTAAKAGGAAMVVGESPKAVANALASVISTATGAPPAK